jgi:hypothetical protein
MRSIALALVASLPFAGCKKAPDPLEQHRALCRSLAEGKQLRQGLSVEECARELKARADLADPGRQAAELVDRVTHLVTAGRGEPQKTELRDALDALLRIGRPAVAPALARLRGSGDPDVRLALARVLIGVCAGDCAEKKFDCIVPALLEGTSEDKPSDVRREAERGLLRCTGEQFGDDPTAWRAWWAERSAQASR